MKKIGKVKSNEFKPRWGLVVIGVNPDFRGGGIGTKLLSEFERLAILDNVAEITLSVKRTNKNAIAVYKKNNWKIYSSDSNSYSMKKELKFCNKNGNYTRLYLPKITNLNAKFYNQYFWAILV